MTWAFQAMKPGLCAISNFTFNKLCFLSHTFVHPVGIMWKRQQQSNQSWPLHSSHINNRFSASLACKSQRPSAGGRKKKRPLSVMSGGHSHCPELELDQQFNEEDLDYWSFRCMGHYVAKSDGDGDRLETFRNSNNKSWAVLWIAFQMNFTTQLKNRNLI